MAEKPMNIIMATVGVEPAGIIESIKRFPCDKIILFTPKEEEAEKCVLKVSEIAKSLRIEFEVVEVDPYAITENIMKMKAKIAENTGSKIILNVTGGRKTLALAATIAGIIAGNHVADIIYITEEENRVISLPRILNPEDLLSDEKRFILKILASKGSSTAEQIKTYAIDKQLVETLGDGKPLRIELPTIWKHLRELEELEYVESEKGKPKRYKLSTSGQLLI